MAFTRCGGGFFRDEDFRTAVFAILSVASAAWAQSSPVINLVANAEGENPVIAPNTWVEIKGANLANAGDIRTWQASDFVNNQMPVQLDGVSVTVNGKSAYVYYISPTQVNILTPPDAMQGAVVVQVTNNGAFQPGVLRAGTAALAVVFRVQRRALRRRDARRREPDRPGQSVSRSDHSCKPGRNCGALRQRLRADFDAGGQRVEYAIGNAFPRCPSSRSAASRRAVQFAGLVSPGAVSVQRGDSGQRSERRQRD